MLSFALSFLTQPICLRCCTGSYDIRKALAAELVVKYSLHKTLANQIKEKLLDYVHIDSGTKFFLLTDQRVMVVDPDAVVPLSIPLHRMCHASCSAVHPSPGVVHTCRFVLHCVSVCLSVCLSVSVSVSVYPLVRRGVELIEGLQRHDPRYRVRRWYQEDQETIRGAQSPATCTRMTARNREPFSCAGAGEKAGRPCRRGRPQEDGPARNDCAHQQCGREAAIHGAWPVTSRAARAAASVRLNAVRAQRLPFLE